MKHALFAGLFSLLATGAVAQPPAALTLHDLDGATHSVPAEWGAGTGVIVFGFAHDARDKMDRWVDAIAPLTSDRWFEAPVIGAVNTLIRPAIRGGMRARYADPARRRHVTPVFEAADAARRLAAPGDAAVVAVAIGADGQVLARADGEVTPDKLARLASALHAAP